MRDGQQVAEGQYTGVRPIGHGTVTDAIVAEKVLSHFSLGATLVLDAVELLVPSVRALCGRLSASLGCPVDAVAFLTPPDRKGLSPHIDDEDVFVLQLSGTKQWTVHEQLRPVPLTPGVLSPSALGPVALTPLLSPGDVMYVPRGTPHHAVSTGATRCISPSPPGAPPWARSPPTRSWPRCAKPRRTAIWTASPPPRRSAPWCVNAPPGRSAC